MVRRDEEIENFVAKDFFDVKAHHRHAAGGAFCRHLGAERSLRTLPG
ncbi:hypothetical protein LNO89_04575 [Klebsiella pneumoniae subsp. pneumoniae]|nr:hypothetical protein [Klebsiella pneumoniae subsp. pneumoniae]